MSFQYFKHSFNTAKNLFLLYLDQKQSKGDFQFLIQNNGLTPLEKSNMATTKIELVKKASFRQFLHSLTSSNIFSYSISTKTIKEKFLI